MKHPALTRVMAVVLAIVCVILFFVSYKNIDEAEDILKKDAASHDKLTERIALYEQLSIKLEGIEEYKKSNEALREREEQHDSDASRHRTDVATHTATEGGYKTGADALWEAKAKLGEQSLGYYGGLQMYNEKKAELEKLKTGVSAMAALAGACTQASAQAAATVPVSHPGEAPVAPAAPTEPVAPTAPTAPVIPIAPVLPATPVVPVAPDRSAYETDEAFALAQAAYEAAAAAYPAALEAYNAAMASYQQQLAAYEAEMLVYNEQKLVYDAAMLEYAPLKAEYDAAMLVYAGEKAAYDSAKAQYDTDKAAYDSANAAYQEYAAKLQGWTALMQQGGALLSTMGAEAPIDTPDAAGLAAMGMLLQQVYASAQPAIQEGEAALAEAKAGLDKAKAVLDKADYTIQGNLENIWYNMGKLEDEAAELEEEKQELTERSERLEEERRILEEQKECENKLRSTRILLMQNEPVAESVEAGGDLVESAKAYARQQKSEYEEGYKGRILVCRLGMAAAVFGIMVLPAAYELLKNRFMLIFPAVLSFAGSAGCVYIMYKMGEGAHYTSIPVVLFSLLYLLAAMPKKKIITYKET